MSDTKMTLLYMLWLGAMGIVAHRMALLFLNVRSALAFPSLGDAAAFIVSMALGILMMLTLPQLRKRK